ncbi:MAG: cation transporter, partial [Oscillospiraceae bacterium]|nr:cation transporter [Oscillospiraceae bacterium]
MENSNERLNAGKRAGLVGILANALLFLAKLTVGSLSGSVSITADAMNNLSDAGSSVVTLLGFRLAQRPADEDHPYGHARYEYLSGLAVAVMILFIGFELAKSSVGKIIAPTEVRLDLVTVGVLVGSMAVKLWLSLYNHRLGKKIGSDTLLATAADSRNDVIATGAVLLSTVIGHFSGLMIDGYMGLAVAVFIFYSGIGLAKDTISPLLGESAGPEIREQILDQIRSQPMVLGFHDLMVHDYGPGRRFASIHV